MPAEAETLYREEQHPAVHHQRDRQGNEIGLGKRTNTILQSAFFALANVMPDEDAIQYMKDAATEVLLKKGEAIVKMNHDAIDAGFDYYVKIDVPADWADAEDDKAEPSH